MPDTDLLAICQSILSCDNIFTSANSLLLLKAFAVAGLSQSEISEME